MTTDDGPPTTDKPGKSSVVGRPSSCILIALALALCASSGACLGLSALAVQRVDLFHATLFYGCRMRSYDLHWQNPQRLPQAVHYDFTKSPDSFVLVIVWMQDGPTLNFSQRLPQRCQ
jgi:hypothetical protein